MRRVFRLSVLVCAVVLALGALRMAYYVAGLPHPPPAAFGRIGAGAEGSMWCSRVQAQIEIALLALPYLYRGRDYGLAQMLHDFDPDSCIAFPLIDIVPDPENPAWHWQVPRENQPAQAAFRAFHADAVAAVAALPKPPPGRDLREALGLNPDRRGRRLGLGWLRDMVRVWRTTDGPVTRQDFFRCTYPMADEVNAIIFTARLERPSVTKAEQEFDDRAAEVFIVCPAGQGRRMIPYDVWDRAGSHTP